MWLVFRYALAAVRAAVRERRELALENVALRHQVEVLTWSRRRPQVRPADRLLWSSLSRVWSSWRRHVVIVQPDTVVRWHRTAWRRYWRWKSRSGKRGRPRIGPELAELIRRMTREACSPAGGRASGCRRGAAPCTPARSRCSQAHRRRPDEAARTSCPRCGSACRGRAGPVLRPRSPQRKGRSGTARATRRHGPAGRARRRCATLHHGAPPGR